MRKREEKQIKETFAARVGEDKFSKLTTLKSNLLEQEAADQAAQKKRSEAEKLEREKNKSFAELLEESGMDTNKFN
ncbi:uncharacterized protein DUF3886 [Streptohalobacillus salinus]|uniref:Uncharacterized protein DUF3886 n=1 Tax=Streptohalobacillus salinus TaxID=621096 RepID=A0A2V3WEW2_9BACI|nr:YqkE family protein [Streptohalobacillus salinus]PXW91694.1 uncharacterized protein DUF3886 [Streptohalobacillus salinus]